MTTAVKPVTYGCTFDGCPATIRVSVPVPAPPASEIVGVLHTAEWAGRSHARTIEAWCPEHRGAGECVTCGSTRLDYMPEGDALSVTCRACGDESYVS